MNLNIQVDVDIYLWAANMSIDIQLGNCIDGLEVLAKESIDCIITSPPYKDSDGYTEQLMRLLFSRCFNVLKNDSLMFVNFGHLAEDKMRPFRVAMLAEEYGFKLQETFVWIKNHYRPIQGKRRVNNLTEFVFMFSKGDVPELDRLSIGIPYADKTNIGRYATADLKCGGNVWPIAYDTIQHSSEKLHNDRFPLELPVRCIKLANLKPGSNICDPFTGSGTTAVACKQLGMNYVGWEINKNYHEIAIKRII